MVTGWTSTIVYCQHNLRWLTELISFRKHKNGKNSVNLTLSEHKPVAENHSQHKRSLMNHTKFSLILNCYISQKSLLEIFIFRMSCWMDRWTHEQHWSMEVMNEDTEKTRWSVYSILNKINNLFHREIIIIIIQSLMTTDQMDWNMLEQSEEPDGFKQNSEEFKPNLCFGIQSGRSYRKPEINWTQYACKHPVFILSSSSRWYDAANQLSPLWFGCPPSPHTHTSQ